VHGAGLHRHLPEVLRPRRRGPGRRRALRGGLRLQLRRQTRPDLRGGRVRRAGPAACVRPWPCLRRNPAT
jgi:hypothetical protein